MTGRLYMQALSSDFDSGRAASMHGAMKRLFLSGALCLGLLMVCASAGPASVTEQPTDPNASDAETPQTERLSQDLEDLIRQLRELRSDYYLKKTKDDAEAEKARRNREILQGDAEELRKQEGDLDEQIQRYKSELDDLRNQLVLRAVLRDVLRRQVEPFHSSQRAAIESGIPYRLQERLGRLETACRDSNDANSVSVGGQLGRFWSYAQEELRLGRSSETYTGRVTSGDGASPQARYFRVGQLVLGYVTEDGLQTGMWSSLPVGRGWSLISDAKQAGQVRDAVEILDRRQGPKLLRLPIAIQPAEDKSRGDGR